MSGSVFQSTSGIEFHEITSASDSDWPAWLRLYEVSFPDDERMSEQFFLDVFAQKSRGESQERHALSVRIAGEPAGMLYFEIVPDVTTAYLWYVAVDADRRGQGVGTEVYQRLCSRVADQGCDLLVFEVEIPEDGPDSAAQRRIDWYRRLGAHLVEGIEYYQSVDTGSPPTRMHLMVHPFRPIGSEELYARLEAVFGEDVRRIG